MKSQDRPGQGLGNNARGLLLLLSDAPLGGGPWTRGRFVVVRCRAGGARGGVIVAPLWIFESMLRLHHLGFGSEFAFGGVVVAQTLPNFTGLLAQLILLSDRASIVGYVKAAVKYEGVRGTRYAPVVVLRVFSLWRRRWRRERR